MAFPTGYSKYQEITIDHTKVAADLTDYVIYVNLADLVKAGADIFDTCRTDGGDIRATKSDGTTQLATEVVVIDTTAKTGELHIRFTGTLSSSTDTIIRIYYNGTDTALATTDTYGRNAVWTDYTAVYHLQGNSTDSKGSYNGTDTSISYGTQKIGQGATFNATGDRISLGTNTAFQFGKNDAFTIQSWINTSSRAANNFLFGRQDGSGSPADEAYRGYSVYVADTSGGLRLDMYSNLGAGGNITRDWANFIAANSTWYMMHFVSGGGGNAATMNMYRNGSSFSGSTASGGDDLSGSTAVTKNFEIGNRDGNNFGPNASFDEFRVRATNLSGNWITTEYNNQNSPSTFYSVGNEVAGGVVINASAQVATFTIPAYTVKRGVTRAPSAQVATFSVPAYAVKISDVVQPSAQVATFTIPAYTILGDGNISVQPAAQVATFSLPARTVTGAVLVLPVAQVATLSIPSYSLNIQRSIVIAPATQVLTFSIPTLAKVGGVWSKVARATSATWSRRSFNDD